MSLKITENNSTYYLKGVISKSTMNFFADYFKRKLSKKKKVVLNIDKIKHIDKLGLNALKDILKRGKQTSKEVFIIGNGCKEIYDDMYQTEAI
jgi:anti-anti-sigma regulatory factor|tara:strand:+ start:295 stop:573 length:279 start_codon:yes stop_codon:yes gene_type:complete